MAVASAPVTCPRCRAPAIWHAQLNQWGCDQCRQMIGPQAPAAPALAVPFCPRCWSPGTWHPQAQRFGCDKCRTLLDPAPAGAPITAITNPHHMKDESGGVVGKVLLTIVVIVVLVVIKLAIRGAI